jgi:hypothetical protein
MLFGYSSDDRRGRRRQGLTREVRMNMQGFFRRRAGRARAWMAAAGAVALAAGALAVSGAQGSYGATAT